MKSKKFRRQMRTLLERSLQEIIIPSLIALVIVSAVYYFRVERKRIKNSSAAVQDSINFYREQYELEKNKNDSLMKKEKLNKLLLLKKDPSLLKFRNSLMKLDNVEFGLAIANRESGVRNVVSRDGKDLGFFQMRWTTIKSLEKLFPDLPIVHSEKEFLRNTDIQVTYYHALVYRYLKIKFPDDDLAMLLRRYNGGEGNWRASKETYYIPILTRYAYLRNISNQWEKTNRT